jgi:GTP-binding protein
VLKVYGDWSTKVKTRDLNDWLKMAVERHPPPAVGGRRVKPKYMAQTKARPPTFVMFASRADQLPDHYRRYLVNSLRESFDLPGVPIRLTVRSNKNPFAEGEEKSGSGLTREKPAEGKTGRLANIRRAAAARAAEGAAEKPKPVGKPKKAKPKAGNPRGRAAKLLRPGVKPKRASRPTSPKRPR